MKRFLASDRDLLFFFRMLLDYKYCCCNVLAVFTIIVVCEGSFWLLTSFYSSILLFSPVVRQDQGFEKDYKTNGFQRGKKVLIPFCILIYTLLCCEIQDIFTSLNRSPFVRSLGHVHTFDPKGLNS